MPFSDEAVTVSGNKRFRSEKTHSHFQRTPKPDSLTHSSYGREHHSLAASPLAPHPLFFGLVLDLKLVTNLILFSLLRKTQFSLDEYDCVRVQSYRTHAPFPSPLRPIP